MLDVLPAEPLGISSTLLSGKCGPVLLNQPNLQHPPLGVAILYKREARHNQTLTVVMAFFSSVDPVWSHSVSKWMRRNFRLVTSMIRLSYRVIISSHQHQIFSCVINQLNVFLNVTAEVDDKSHHL